MFGRQSKTSAPPQDATAREERPGAKNRPTPKRRDQEAARKQPLVITDRKAAKAADRAKRAEANRNMRAAMQSGDDRYLPLRDKGPVKRFVRDSIDARWNLGEFLMPFMIVVLLLQVIRSPWTLIAFYAIYAGITVAVVDGFLAYRRIKKNLLAKFGPDTATKGLASYAALRMMQMRRLRMPKPQVARGQRPS